MSNFTKYDIEFCKNIAKSRNGECLSEKYTGFSDYLLWKCSSGHISKRTLQKVIMGRWCKQCYEERRQITIEKCKIEAEKRGGKFLGENIIIKNNKQLLPWMCSEGHTFQACFNNVQQKYWCPTCAEKQREKTRIKKYGFPFLMQNKELRHKANETNNKIVKLQHWFSKEIIPCHGGFEVAVVEYLNKNHIDYNFQPQTFLMPDGRTYTPDLYLVEQDLWIEIKGYFWGDAKEKWEWFQGEYPNSELWDEKKLKVIGLWKRILDLRKEERRKKSS